MGRTGLIGVLLELGVDDELADELLDWLDVVEGVEELTLALLEEVELDEVGLDVADDVEELTLALLDEAELDVVQVVEELTLTLLEDELDEWEIDEELDDEELDVEEWADELDEELDEELLLVADVVLDEDVVLLPPCPWV